MEFSVRVSKESMARVKRMLSGIQKDVEKAIVYAINETLPGAKTDIVAELQKEVNLPKSVLLHGPSKSGKKPTFKIVKAKTQNPSGKISTIGANIPLIHYRTAPKKISYKPRVIRVQIRKDKGERVLKHAFVPRLKSGHQGFFVREGTSRLPIKELFGPRIPDIFSNPEPTAKVLAKVEERMDKNLTRAVDRIIAQNR